jgi:hypothetical protein
MTKKIDIPKSSTTEQQGEYLLRDIQQMSPDEKAHLRAKLDKAFNPLPM